MITYLAVCDPFVDLIKYFGEPIQQQAITFLTDFNQIIHKPFNHITRISRRNKTLGVIISMQARSNIRTRLTECVRLPMSTLRYFGDDRFRV